MRFSDWADDPRKTARWQRFRRMLIGKFPVCERCGQRVSTEGHHLISVRHARWLAFDIENVRALCHQCHVDAHNGPISYRPRLDPSEPEETPPYER